MSNYIAAFILLPFLAFFPAQYVLQTVNHHKISNFEAIVEVAKEEAKQDGYFTPENIENMKSEITKKYKDISTDEIEVDVTTVPKYRVNHFDERELIEYEISVPIDKIIVGGSLFGISDDKSKKRYPVKGAVPSERILEDEI